MARHNSADEFPEDSRNSMHTEPLQQREDAPQLGDVLGDVVNNIAKSTHEVLQARLVTEQQRLYDLIDAQDSGDKSIEGDDIRRQTDEVNLLIAEISKYDDTPN